MPVDYSEKKIIGDMSQRLALMNYMEENEVVSFSPETRRNKKIVERLDLELMAVTSEQKDYDREIPLSNAKYEVETEEDKDMDLNLRQVQISDFEIVQATKTEEHKDGPSERDLIDEGVDLNDCADSASRKSNLVSDQFSG